MLHVIYDFFVAEVGLGDTCPTPDACLGSNSQCLGGVCKCLDDYYDDNTETQNGGNCQSSIYLFINYLVKACTYIKSDL